MRYKAKKVNIFLIGSPFFSDIVPILIVVIGFRVYNTEAFCLKRGK